ncbi:hypothetical protein B0H13DRAFT_2432174 [Mycena leptocephala]|nr:hypothetical protein B0H13DRAFT_2432174 [Mycena leptocephala]
MAFGLIVIVLASICQHQFFFRSMMTGVLACTALTGALYRHTVHPDPAARLRLPNSAALSMDVSMVDTCAQWFHAAWTAPIQMTICLIILLVEVCPRPLFLPSSSLFLHPPNPITDYSRLTQLGPSALAGFALFLIIPLQERIMAHQFSLWQASMKWTDERAGGYWRLLSYIIVPYLFLFFYLRVPSEFYLNRTSYLPIPSISSHLLIFYFPFPSLILSHTADKTASMRVVKHFCYEGSFLVLLFRIRTQELRGIRKIQHSQSANIALAFSLPVLAATLAFVTCTEKSKQFDVAVVFALFQLLRQPMMFLPRAPPPSPTCATPSCASARLPLDANVSKALFHSAIQGLVAQGKTVLLVMHALHFLAQCDYIYTLDGRRIAEVDVPRAHRVRERVCPARSRVWGAKPEDAGGEGAGEGEDEVQRTTGGVAWSVYGYYAKAGGCWLTVPVIVLVAVFMQGSQVANSYALVWWQGNTFDKPFSFYQILYALLWISQATFTYLLCVASILMLPAPLHVVSSGLFMEFFVVRVSKNLHHQAIVNIFHAPMSFFADETDHQYCFGKDIDTIDNALPSIVHANVYVPFVQVICFPVDPLAVILVLAQVHSSIIVITVLEHYFIVAAVLIIFGFSYFLQFYRSSALEMKRLDSMQRSILYAHLSESLTGLPTIRSYGEIERFMGDNIYYIDLECALFLTVTNQRWLAVRLDALGSLLVFLVAVFAAVGLNGVNPAEIGLILTYTSATRLSAEVENYMNSVERVVHYARGDVVPQEAAHESTPQNKPAADWPAHGAIEFKDVTMAYRPGLPNVLHGISLKIHAGEKIGVVGRTGAGKSSLTLCLLRIVEYLGEIIVDGVNIGEIGLTDLRSNIAIIPQEPILFSGTVRTALDPFSKYDDARLWDALRRSYLVCHGRLFLMETPTPPHSPCPPLLLLDVMLLFPSHAPTQWLPIASASGNSIPIV